MSTRQEMMSAKVEMLLLAGRAEHADPEWLHERADSLLLIVVGAYDPEVADAYRHIRTNARWWGTAV